MVFKSLKNPRSYSDEAWKVIVGRYLQQFLQFFFPQVAALIDWTVPFEILDKELQAITREAMVGKRIVDMLFKVRLKSGQDHILCLHIDIQGQYEAGFSERMYIYNYLVYNLYKLPVITLVVLADNRPKWRPTQYQSKVGDYVVTTFNFPIAKLLDWAGKEEELLAQSNPFAIVVAVHLMTQKTRRYPELRFDYKSTLTLRLYERGFSRDEIIDLYGFIDRIMRLPEPLEIQYNTLIKRHEEEIQVKIITSMERMGIQQGIQQGMQKGIQKGIQQGFRTGVQQGMQKGIQTGIYQEKLETAKRLLKTGFSVELIQQITNLPGEEIKGV